MGNVKQSIEAILLLGTIAVVLVVGLISTSQFTSAALNESEINKTVDTNLSITNDPPRAFITIIDDIDAASNEVIDLIPSDNQSVWCNGTVTDQNGENDITNVNATFWNQATGSGADVFDAAENWSRRYHNSSCNIDTSFGNLTTSSFECWFNVTYWANSSTSWNCTVGVIDATGGKGYNSTIAQITETIAIAINQTGINFGTLALGANTGTDDFEINVTNVGNQVLDLQFDAYRPDNLFGGDFLNDPEAMNCTLGNLGVGNVTYVIADPDGFPTNNSVAFADRTVMEETGKVQNNTNLEQVQTQFWPSAPTSRRINYGVGLPISGVQGDCNGVLLIHGVYGGPI